MTTDLSASEPAVAGYPSPFTEEDEAYRLAVRTFLDREIEPRFESIMADWETRHELWKRAGKAGILGAAIPEEHGGPGLGHIPNVILSYEIARSQCYGTVGSLFCTDMATSALLAGASRDLIEEWAPRILSGEAIQCMAITEPEAGSDALAIRCTARRDGDDYVISGGKTYITNGDIADVIYLVARTGEARSGKSLTLFLVDTTMPGVTRRKLKTMGFPGGNTAELFFDDVRVPATHVLGGEGGAMRVMMSAIEYDRLQIGARALGQAELAYKLTVEYAKLREMFGKHLIEFQNTQFKLASMKTEVEVGRAFLHESIRKVRAGVANSEDGDMLKLWLGEMSSRVIDECVQLFGGMGFMDESPISRIYTSNRVLRIYAGTSEILRRSIARSI